MTITDFLKLSAFIFGAGLGVKLYVYFKELEGKVQNDAINKQKAEIDRLYGRAEEKKQIAQDARKEWNDFANSVRDVTKRDSDRPE